jgi:hypothetical protein
MGQCCLSSFFVLCPKCACSLKTPIVVRLNIYTPFRYEEFEDTKFRVVTRICKSKKNRQQWQEELGQMFATTQRQDRGALQTIMTYNISIYGF